MRARLFTALCLCTLLIMSACDTTEAPKDASDASAEISAEYSDEASAEFSDEISDISTETGKAVDRSLSKVLVSEGCSYTAKGTPHGDYPDDGKKLTDGVLGADIGVGWATTQGEFILDLGERRDDLADFNILLRGGNWGINAPDRAEYFVSDDGKAWTSIGVVEGDAVTKAPADASWIEHSYLFESESCISARYVKFAVSGNNMNFAWAHEIAVWSYIPLEKVPLHSFNGTEALTNLTFTNLRDEMMGDQDAPGYCVYSSKGFNKSEMRFELSQAQVSTLGKNGSRIAAYVFLGANVYNGNSWLNCCDAGFVYSNETTGWRLFAATATDENGQRGWFDGGKTLSNDTVYRLVLDTSLKNGEATVTAYDMRDNSVADSITFKFYGSKTDGKDTAFLTDIAIDWAGEQSFIDTKGNPTDDWVEITKANTNQGLFLKNVRLYGCSLFDGDTKYEWTKDKTDHRGIWSDGDSPIDYVTTKIYNITEDCEYIVDLTLEK